MTHRFFLKLWPEMRLGATVMTRKQNKHRANGKLLVLQKQRRPDRSDQMLRSRWLVFFYANGIVYKGFVPPGQTVNQQFYLKVLKRLRDSVWKERPEMCSSGDRFLHHDNAPAHTALSVQQFLAKNNMTVIPHPPYSFTWPCAMQLFPLPLYTRPDERETYCGYQCSEKENAGGIEQHQHWRVPEMFSAVGKTLVQVYWVKRRVLWKRLEV